MNKIKKDELYRSLKSLLKSRGVKLSNPTYSKAVRRACSFLTDTVNLAHQGVVKARVQVDTNLEKLRQTIHEATAPKPPILDPRTNSAKKKAAGKVAPKAAVSKATRTPAVKKKTAKRKSARRKKTSA